MQFTVFRNPGRSARAVPFVIQIQSTRLARAVGRVVMPLALVGPAAPEDHPLTPHLVVQRQRVYANPLDLVAIPAAALTAPLGILGKDDQGRIIRALDEMTSRA